MRLLLLSLALLYAVNASPKSRVCEVGDECDTCTIAHRLVGQCDDPERKQFLYCNHRTKKVGVSNSMYLECVDRIWVYHMCSSDNTLVYNPTTKECVDPSETLHHAQGTSGSGRVGDVCSFNTDCLGGMYCAIGQCRCLSTYIAVDAYCYEKISPSESGCFYDVQCSSVWPDSFCKNGQCMCPNDDMIAVKTKDGTMCVWATSAEPACPLPSLPPPDSPAALVVLPAVAGKNSVSIAPCNPHSSSIPPNAESLQSEAHEYKCAVQGNNANDLSPVDVSDLYDCIDNTKFWKEQGVQGKNHPVGVCCMNRAFTCMQPKKGESDALGSVPRWWFNNVMGSCQQFLFDPTSADVSPNNFETLDHCESFCKDTCPRGNPAYLPAKQDIGQSPHIGCTSSNPCPEPYNCLEVASQSLCCPSRKNICSDSGARFKDPRRNVPYDAGLRFDQLTGEEANFAMGISTRYYYNPTDGQCHPFTYNGFLGNFNNFHNQADCQIFCARLQCTHGNPLTNGNGSPQRCQRDVDCPSTHTCATEHGVCCPSSQTLCTEPLRIGDCKQSVRQFWYNAETRTCEAFQYTGCQGNNNRFNTLNECQSFCKNINAEPKCLQGKAYVDFSGKYMQCGESLGGNGCPANYECHFDGLVHGCCPSKAYTCSLQMNKGIACGSGSSYRYYYNNQLKECQSYLFLGCDGNSNNFPTVEKCQSYCEIAVCPNGGSPLRTNSKIRTCSNTEPCPHGYECSMVEANGITQRRCCPTKVAICSKPPQMGMLPKCSSGTGQTRFYFNMALQTCSSYTSNGCDTSLNSFASKGECEDFCQSAGCVPGDSVYKDPNSNKPFLCNTALQNNCPSNYACTLNALTQEHVCCGSDSMGVCPSGEKAFIDSRTNTPRQCAMAADGKCPSGYLCRFSQTNHKYYCCGNVKGAFCPAGRALFRFPTTQLPSQCHISASGNTCPPGFACLSDVPNAFQGYCCSTNPICPGSSTFHLDEKTMMPTSCSAEGFAFCPQGFTCQQQPEGNAYYCCSGQEKEGVNDGCPPMQYAYIFEGTVKGCDPFNADELQCPTDYTCQWSLKNQKYQCCGTRPIRQVKPTHIDDGCPAKQFAMLDRRSGKPRICTAGETKNCPIGFFCQFSARKNQFQCCGQSAGCPARRAAYIAVDGNAQECIPGPDMCAEGYECVKSSIYDNKNICCSREGNECAENEEFINGECVVRVKPGGACHRSEECGGGSSCIDSTCTCEPEKTIINGICTQKECTENQIRLNGQCVDRVDIGQSCKSSLQCVSNSRCIAGRCDCAKGEHIEGNKCVKGEAKEKEEKPEINVAQACPDRSMKPYLEKKKLKSCTSSEDCPTSYSCQFSDSANESICCGKEKGETRKERPKGKSITKTGSHCPIGMTPYLLNGKAKTCSTGSCPYGYSCKLSEALKEYYCCSKKFSKKGTGYHQTGAGCPRGSALLYPTTQEPVLCEPTTKGCPAGYLCLQHKSNKLYQCCSVEAVQYPTEASELHEVQCPSYMVRVYRDVNGVTETMCARDCPSGQTAINGICQTNTFL
ncbi:unnamed protein product [Auanema sp. JU1783]|nr:unnamed protein product [Auanema sp. JU1783]